MGMPYREIFDRIYKIKKINFINLVNHVYNFLEMCP
jgi:hypothetical protein